VFHNLCLIGFSVEFSLASSTAPRRNFIGLRRMPRALPCLGLAPGALFRNRLLDLLLADGLQLLILRGAKNFLQLRRGLVVDSSELSHLLHSGQRSIEFWTLFLEDRQHLHFLLRRELKLLRQCLELRRRIS